jgi:hypothetical protein
MLSFHRLLVLPMVASKDVPQQNSVCMSCFFYPSYRTNHRNFDFTATTILMTCINHKTHRYERRPFPIGVILHKGKGKGKVVPVLN